MRHPGHPEPLAAGERVLLVDRKDRRHLVTLAAGDEFNYHAGAVAHDDLIGQPEGSRVRSTKGAGLRALRPTAEDWTLEAPRGAQVVYPKDQAMIVALADICPGAVVVEGGAGSGALTCALLRAVGESGRVLSFEHRADHADYAEANVATRFGGHPATWELRRVDIAEGLAGQSCDRAVLDVAEPWGVLDEVCDALRPGGMLAAYTPTVPQVMGLREAADADERWGLGRTAEAMLRYWHVAGSAVRPDHRMVAHTAFITVLRRLPAPRAGSTSASEDGEAPS